MDLILTVRSEETPGPDLKIDCPKCNTRDASATSHQQWDRVYFLLFIAVPGLSTKATFVNCQHCKVKLHSKLSIEELEQHTGSDLSPYLLHQASLPVKVLAICSVLLVLTPVLPLILATLTLILTRETPGWPRRLAKIGLVLSIIFHVLLGILLITKLGF